MSLLIHNITIFTNNEKNTVLNGHAVLIEGNRIEAIDEERVLNAQYPNAKKLDGQGRLLMPGLTNVHMHFYGTYARGLALSSTPNNFHEILQQLWWALDKVLDLDAVYYSALIPAITAIKKGVTSIIDHHASPNAIDGSLDRIEDALTMVGMRGILCYEVSDRGGKTIRDQGLAENERYIRRCQAAKETNANHMFDGMMGLHASFTLDDESLEKAASLSQALGRGCHIHMLEDQVDETLTQQKYRRSVVERLNHFNILGKDSIAAHGIFVSDSDIELLAETDTIIAHQAQSNMNNAVGRADVFKLLEHDLLVGIGTDGMTPDLRAEVRTGYLMHKHHLQDCNAGWTPYETMTLKHNPAIYQRLSGHPIGQIKKGYLADLILVDYFPPTPLSAENFWGHFLFGLVDADVDTTMINGKIVMQNKKLVDIDEIQINQASTKTAQQVWARFHR
ncbi:MAG: putative aminohydrolase SsnA [Chloroflexota bacterium]